MMYSKRSWRYYIEIAAGIIFVTAMLVVVLVMAYAVASSLWEKIL